MNAYLPKCWIITIGLSLFYLIGFSQSPQTDFFLGGIHVNAADMERWVHTVRDAGMNTVEVTVYAKQWLWDTDDLDIEKSNTGIINEIRAAKKAGLKVILILRIQLQHWFPENHFLWHGMIAPQGTETVKRWFEKYTAYNEYWAAVCANEGVDVLAIGSELNEMSATKQLRQIPDLYNYFNSILRQKNYEYRILKYQSILEEKDLWTKGKEDYKDITALLEDKILALHNWSKQVSFAAQNNRLEKINQRRALLNQEWINLIKKVRNIYKGKITYAANFDNYHEVGFWKYLDYMGVNAYFPLREAKKEIPSDAIMRADFEKSWRKIFADFEAFQLENNLRRQPILFTELGYTRYENATVESWVGSGFSVIGKGEEEQLIIWDRVKKYSKERELAVAALHQVVKSTPVHLKGILYWKLTIHDYLLKEEPFALWIDKTPRDPLQEILAKFRE